MEEIKSICHIDDCTGCMACANICTHNAIVIKEDTLGFKYPYISIDVCVGCGLCSKVCPALNLRTLIFPKSCYASVFKDDETRLDCASGGFATALSISILNRGGIVVGCSGEDMHHVRHIIVENVNDLNKLQGSKYVQSEIGIALYRKIRDILKTGVPVLFIGTACQTAGLQNFMLKSYENLYTVDIVCHGVPSQKMLDDNMKFYPGIEPNSIKFREKPSKSNGKAIRFGWSSTIQIDDKTQKVFVPSHKDNYMAAFLDCLTFRQCCYRCKYAYSARQSDITICDFWGLGNLEPSKFNAHLGVSGVLISTDKGKKIFDEASQFLEFEKRQIQEVVEGNNQLKCPSRSNQLRSNFENLYMEKGFEYAVKHTTIRNNQIRRFLLWPDKLIKLVAAKFNIKFRN